MATHLTPPSGEFDDRVQATLETLSGKYGEPLEFGPGNDWCGGRLPGRQFFWQADEYYVFVIADTAQGLTVIRAIGTPECYFLALPTPQEAA